MENTRVTVKSGKIAWIAVIVLLSPLILYYLYTRGFVYFNFSRAVYTDYFWFRAPWLLAHVILGITATLVGPFQFVPALRRRHRQLHRNLGKLYMFCVFVSTLISFYLDHTSQLGLVYAVGLFMLGVVWSGSTGMAYLSIRKGNVGMHREWMIKSYVITLSFVGFRAVEDTLAKASIGDFIGRKVLMAWACWAIPFFVTEVVLQCIKLYRKRRPIAAKQIQVFSDDRSISYKD